MFALRIASTVVVPANARQPSPPPPPFRKRRESTDPADNEESLPAKRSRLANASNQDDKSRSRRLFGSVLGNLGRVSQDNRTKKRLEVEAKMQEKLRVQHEEEKADLKRNREIKEEGRKVFAGHAASLRRKNERNMAHFLSTRATPKIYYLPFELTPAQRATISRQKDQAGRNQSPSRGIEDEDPQSDIAEPKAPETSHERTISGKDDELASKEDATMRDSSDDGKPEASSDKKAMDEEKHREVTSSPKPHHDDEEEVVEY